MNDHRLIRRGEARVRRAASVLGQGVYGLGRGGFDPKAPTPFDAEGRCDCTGFASWLLGMSRHQAPWRKPWSSWLPWLETTAIYRSLERKDGPFSELDAPFAGCFVVSPDRLGRQGHIAIVLGPEAIIDCAAGKPPAIQKRTMDWFKFRPHRFFDLRD